MCEHDRLYDIGSGAWCVDCGESMGICTIVVPEKWEQMTLAQLRRFIDRCVEDEGIARALHAYVNELERTFEYMRSNGVEAT